jgi:hypothetical protein
MSKKRDLTNWGPVPGQLELDLDGDATGRDTHSGQHEDVFTIEVPVDEFERAWRHEPFGAPVIYDSKASRDFGPFEVDQDDFVDHVHAPVCGTAERRNGRDIVCRAKIPAGSDRCEHSPFGHKVNALAGWYIDEEGIEVR